MIRQLVLSLSTVQVLLVLLLLSISLHVNFNYVDAAAVDAPFLLLSRNNECADAAYINMNTIITEVSNTKQATLSARTSLSSNLEYIRDDTPWSQPTHRSFS